MLRSSPISKAWHFAGLNCVKQRENGNYSGIWPKESCSHMATEGSQEGKELESGSRSHALMCLSGPVARAEG